MAMGRWIQTHKTAFFAAALLLITASMASAIRERIVKGKNSGLIIFGVAFVTMAALLSYSKVKNGSLY